MMPDIGFVPFIDAVIAFTVLECLGLLAWRLATRRGLAVPDFMANLLSGLCLMIALRCLAGGADPRWAALSLLLAGLAHGLDLRRRWLAERAPSAASAAAQDNPIGRAIA